MAIARDPLAGIRAEILAQPLDERADYALDILAFYLAPRPRFFDGLAALGLDLCQGDARVLFALDQRRGRAVTNDGLLAARYIDRPVDDWDTGDKVVRAIYNIRQALEPLGLPVQIEHVSDQGYVLHAPDDFHFEDAAPADLFSHVGARA